MGTNFLKSADAAKKYLTVAFGRQAVKGHLCWGSVTGASPNHQITAYNALGEGEWDGCESAYYKGENIPASDYHFHTGAKATGMIAGPQQVDSFFPKDVPHSRTAAIGYKIPQGLGDANIETTPPLDFEGIFRTKRCPDFNSAGVQTGFSYSPNPGRAIVEGLRTYARLPNLPTIWTSAAAYWLSRIDWAAWTDFRDFHDQTETVDYRDWIDVEGFGLTASCYSGTDFQTFVAAFIQPALNYPSASVSPFAEISINNFSCRFEGFIKFPYSETFTLSIEHDDGVRCWIAAPDNFYTTALIDQWNNLGTHTATFNATAGVYYKIRIEWNNGSAPAKLLFKWSSTSQTFDIVSSKYLYPLVTEQKLYEFHGYFEQPTNPGDFIRTVLLNCNSIPQDVNGKLRFVALDALTPSFSLAEPYIDSFEFRPRDILKSDPVTAFEANFKDLESQFLAKPASPVRLELETFSRKTDEKIQNFDLFVTTRWRALKILKMQERLNIGKNLAKAISPLSKSYPPMPGNLISVTHRKLDTNPKYFLVRNAIDPGIAEQSGLNGEIEKREFQLQEWDYTPGGAR